MPAEANILTALLLGLLLGVKHALDADHVVTVTTIVSRSGSILRSALVGLSWGIGHTLTLLSVGFAVLVLKLTIPDKLALSMEFAIGVLLVVLGVPLLKQLIFKRAHIHSHQHVDKSHFHSHYHHESSAHEHRHLRRPLLVGMLHGLAGSGALTLLVLGTMSSVGQGLVFLLVFGLGSTLGMLFFTGLMGIPFKLASGSSLRLNLWFHGGAGFVSIALGLLIMWRIGVVDGLFHSTS